VSLQVVNYQVDDSTAVKIEIEPNWWAAKAAGSNCDVTLTWSRGIRQADAGPR
jgi:hypothetical protein